MTHVQMTMVSHQGKSQEVWSQSNVICTHPTGVVVFPIPKSCRVGFTEFTATYREQKKIENNKCERKDINLLWNAALCIVS